MNVSCAFPPSLATPQYAAIAEGLGFERVWLYDSPSLYHDIWATMARVAERTSTIGLGTAVLVPNNRHPVVTASAIATIEELAPGRLAVAVGTGFTARMTMGKRPLPWSFVRNYLVQLRALLNGDAVEVEGAMVQMMQPRGFGPARPIHVPIVVAANGPKGIEVARDLGDGVMTVATGVAEFDWCALLCFGTVLGVGEALTDPRVVAAAGPAYTVAYHAIYESDPAAVDNLPGGAQWRAELEEIPASHRHLALHEDHLVRVSGRDRAVVSPELFPAFSFTGTLAEVHAKAAAAAATGVTELVYQPIGEDAAEIERELTMFRGAVLDG